MYAGPIGKRRQRSRCAGDRSRQIARARGPKRAVTTPPGGVRQATTNGSFRDHLVCAASPTLSIPMELALQSRQARTLSTTTSFCLNDGVVVSQGSVRVKDGLRWRRCAPTYTT
jgi:hypothetical protein